MFNKQENNNIQKSYITRAKARKTKHSNKYKIFREDIVEVIDITHT